MKSDAPLHTTVLLLPASPDWRPRQPARLVRTTLLALACASGAGCLGRIDELRERYEQDTSDGLDLDIISTPDTLDTGGGGDAATGPDASPDVVPTDGSSDTTDVTVRDTTPAVPSTSTVFALLASECSPCHIDRAEGGLLLLDDGELLSRLLLPSVQLPALQRVAPGDPDSSYLFLKVTGRHVEAGGLGEPMPLGTPLSGSDTDLIRRWIEAGSSDAASTAP